MPDSKFVLESFFEFVTQEYPALLEAKDPGTPFSLELAKDTLDKYFAEIRKGVTGRKLPESLVSRTAEPIVKELYGQNKVLQGGLVRLFSSQLSALNVDWNNFQATPQKQADYLKLIQILAPKLTNEELGNQKGLTATFEKHVGDMKTLSDAEVKKVLEKWIESRGEKSIQDFGNDLWKLMVWSLLLPQADKDALAGKVMTKAQELGWDTESWTSSILKSPRFTELFRVGCPSVAVETMVQNLPTPPPTVTVTAMLEPDKSSKVFKVNRTGAGGADDYEDATLQGLADNIGSVFQRLVQGEITDIKSILISTSCDRYRNTGDAKDLTWGQLSYARSVSLSSLVLDIAEKSGLPAESVAKINDLIQLDFKGENGDGTSGPNPLDPKNFGYYNESKKWVNLTDTPNADRKKINVVEIDDEGIPVSAPKTEDLSAEFNKMKDQDSYDPFRYSNVVIEYLITKEDKTEKEGGVQITAKLSYPMWVEVPDRYRQRKISIPLPRITSSRWDETKGGGKGSTKCPRLGAGTKTKTKFGLEITPVNVASWKGEIKRR